MTNDPSTTTNEPATDNPLPFEPYLPAVIQPSAEPGRVERFLTRALGHK